MRASLRHPSQRRIRLHLSMTTSLSEVYQSTPFRLGQKIAQWNTGGTSGAALASRLSEDPAVSVLVLEKGQVVDTWTTRVPLLSSNPTSKDFLGVRWMSMPQKHVDNRTLPMVRGEALGGSSRINGALYTRGKSYKRITPYARGAHIR